MEENDHDLLIAINASLRLMTEEQREFINRYETNHADIVARVTVLENKDSRDSERFKGIADEIRRSLANAEKINVLTTDVNALGVNLRATQDSVKDLKGKSNLWDIANAIGVAIAAALAYFK